MGTRARRAIALSGVIAVIAVGGLAAANLPSALARDDRAAMVRHLEGQLSASRTEVGDLSTQIASANASVRKERRAVRSLAGRVREQLKEIRDLKREIDTLRT